MPNKKGDNAMRRTGSILSAAILLGAMAGSARAADDVLLKEEAAENYCHMKFQALRPSMLGTDRPELKRSLGDVIDFYGSCEETPTSLSQLDQQRRDAYFRFGRDYEDGD
jgi:hypothetical protein